MTLTNVLLTVAYDGTNYAGWQRQDNAVAVQQRLEEALTETLNQPIKVAGASRTDAGVHALGQRAAFAVEHMPIPIEKLPQVINSHLPEGIAVQAAQLVSEDFNPRFDTRAKTYCYQMHNTIYRNPLLSRYSAYAPYPMLDAERMSQAAAHFVGTHDFAAFCATGSSAKTTERTIFFCEVERGEKDSLIKMTVNGDGFLYNMVRIIAGTVLYAGIGKLSPQDIPDIIASKDRSKAGKTMPPEGLTLVEVMYDEEKY
ncbi:MAG: tRNA pseudouridine(38-40) synthase TruA [Defluviitaleaceae bacterium]|nr:tRNA pseudouridine(38-40) synthase TruA [Defluviitaleaceae bacterium]